MDVCASCAVSITQIGLWMLSLKLFVSPPDSSTPLPPELGGAQGGSGEGTEGTPGGKKPSANMWNRMSRWIRKDGRKGKGPQAPSSQGGGTDRTSSSSSGSSSKSFAGEWLSGISQELMAFDTLLVVGLTTVLMMVLQMRRHQRNFEAGIRDERDQRQPEQR